VELDIKTELVSHPGAAPAADKNSPAVTPATAYTPAGGRRPAVAGRRRRRRQPLSHAAG